MRRAVLVPALACTAILASSAYAGPPGRTITVGYTGSGVDSPAEPVPAVYGDASGQGSQAEAVTVATLPSDRTVSVRLADRDGLPVLAAVVQHLGTDSRTDVELGRVCGATAAPLRLAKPGAKLTVYLLAGSCPTGPSVPTTGTATLGFWP
jgi:hypothetical protein